MCFKTKLIQQNKTKVKKNMKNFIQAKINKINSKFYIKMAFVIISNY